MGSKNSPGVFDCYANALPDEPMFILLARDPSAPSLIEWWADNRESAIDQKLRPEGDRAMVAEARQCAKNMRAWRLANDGVWRCPQETASECCGTTEQATGGREVSEEIAQHCEEATRPDRSIDGMIATTIGATMPDDPAGWPPKYTASVDAALTLLPARACNIDLFSFGGGGRDDLPRGATCWGFKFHDQDQLVGTERAKAEVLRLRKDSGGLFKVSGPPKMLLERAIAEQFMEFSSTHAANAALAICAAALRARAGGDVGGSEHRGSTDVFKNTSD